MEILEFIKKNWYFIVAILILIGLNGIFIIYHFRTLASNLPGNNLEVIDSTEENRENYNEPKQEEIQSKIKVDIKGYVKKPGVYEVEAGSIINDVITLAGGLKTNASTDNLNLSKKLTDEMVIIVYSKSEVSKMTEKVAPASCNCNTEDITECTKDKASVIESGNNVTPNDTSNEPTINSKISLNKATLAELMTVSGIGEAKAKSIIAYREAKAFTSIDELKSVSGIGDKLFEQIKDYFTL